MTTHSDTTRFCKFVNSDENEKEIIKEVRVIDPIISTRLFDISSSHLIWFTLENKKPRLYVNCNPFIVFSYQFNVVVKSDFEFYLNYPNRHQNIDIRNLTLPKVERLTYFCKPDAEYVNLPNNIETDFIEVINGKGNPLVMSKEMYKVYIKLSPALLYNHQNISIRHSRLKINHNYQVDPDAKYSFYLADREMIIHTNALHCPLTIKNCSQFKGFINKIVFYPSSLTSLMIEIDEVKQLIECMNLQLLLKFKY